MIWTVPLGLELELPASMSDSSFQDFGIDGELQACSLAIAGAYLKSLPTPALVALVGAQCPGMGMISIHERHKEDLFNYRVLPSLSLSLSLSSFSSCSFIAHSSNEFPQISP
jgi:hypothetical protein